MQMMGEERGGEEGGGKGGVWRRPQSGSPQPERGPCAALPGNPVIRLELQLRGQSSFFFFFFFFLQVNEISCLYGKCSHF